MRFPYTYIIHLVPTCPPLPFPRLDSPFHTTIPLPMPPLPFPPLHPLLVYFLLIETSFLLPSLLTCTHAGMYINLDSAYEGSMYSSLSFFPHYKYLVCFLLELCLPAHKPLFCFYTPYTYTRHTQTHTHTYLNLDSPPPPERKHHVLPSWAYFSSPHDLWFHSFSGK